MTYNFRTVHGTWMVEFHTSNMLYLYHRSRAYSRHISSQPGILSASSSEPVPLKLRQKTKAEDIQLGQKNYLPGSLI